MEPAAITTQFVTVPGGGGGVGGVGGGVGGAGVGAAGVGGGVGGGVGRGVGGGGFALTPAVHLSFCFICFGTVLCIVHVH